MGKRPAIDGARLAKLASDGRELYGAMPQPLFSGDACLCHCEPVAHAACSAGGDPRHGIPPPTAPAERTPLETRADKVVALINGKGDPEQIFSAGFLKAASPAQLAAISAMFIAQLGNAMAVETLNPRGGTRAALVIRFERGTAKGSLAIDPAQENRITGLLFTQLDPVAQEGVTPAKIAADLAALPGTVTAWFAPLVGAAPLVSINPDTPLALGSTFKLYVLAALAEDVKAGRRKWDDVVPLTAKSYPSGQLQTWPKGSPVTLHTLASMMIAISDNTATDQLIAALGKARILELMKASGHADPSRNDPFLTTRELFVLKAGGAPQIAGWRKSDTPRRAAILESRVSEDPTLEQVTSAFAGGPAALDIEWYASPADLAKLIGRMRRTADPKAFEIMAINPAASAAILANWRYVGFKGGSEPGVINTTWLLTDKGGRDWVLTAGWNNEGAAVDDVKFVGLAQRILLLPR